MSIRQHAARFSSDERGNIAVLSVVAMTVMVGFAAVAIDGGKLFVDRRKAQATTDLAAISAASNLANAAQMASRTMSLNNVASVQTPIVEFGTYAPDATIAFAQRFQAATPGAANAVRVTLQTQSPLFFGRLLVGRSFVPIQTTATATSTAFAAFAIGSRLAKIDGGVLNQLLGAELGTSLSLSASDYQALIDTRVDVLGTVKAAATRASLTGPTYQSILSSSLSAGTLLGAGADVAGSGAGASALRTASNGLATGSTIMLGSMFDLGPYAPLPLGQMAKSDGTISLFDLLVATASLSNAKHQVSLGLDLQTPGIVGASLSIATGERPAGSGWFVIGRPGVSVHTAQTRILLQLQVQGLGGLATLAVPVYAEVARGTATLASLACGVPDIQTSRVTLGVTPGIVDAWIGAVSAGDFTNFATAPNPGPATLVHTPLFDIAGRAHATMGDGSVTSVAFTYADVQGPTAKTVQTTNYLSSLFGGLISNLSVTASSAPLGIGLSMPPAQAVASSLNAVAAPLDQKLATIFATLGVGLGQADVWVSGLRCDGAVLVN